MALRSADEGAAAESSAAGDTTSEPLAAELGARGDAPPAPPAPLAASTVLGFREPPPSAVDDNDAAALAGGGKAGGAGTSPPPRLPPLASIPDAASPGVAPTMTAGGIDSDAVGGAAGGASDDAAGAAATAPPAGIAGGIAGEAPSAAAREQITVKCAVLGDTGVGKTSLILR
jgi:Gtp-binding protein of the ras superfamily involved in termination of M-phase